MKISIRQFISNVHSWGVCGTSYARAFIKEGYDVHMCSTNGFERIPEDLNHILKCRNCSNDSTRNDKSCSLDRDYDLALSYTMPMHWGEYTSFVKPGGKKLAIWNYDGSIIPPGFSKYHNFVDYVLPSSKYSRDTFLKAGIPADKLITVPHGYDEEFDLRSNTIQFKTNKKYKYFVNIQQPHHRKNIVGILESWGRAFTNKDDVCLIAKVRAPKKGNVPEVSFITELSKIKKKYKNLADVIVYDQFVPYISDLYRSIDINFSMSHIECFHFPSLESLAAGKINICSGYGGNTDFCNENNSLMIEGELRRAPKEMHYWEASVYGEAFYPNIDDAASKLRLAYTNHDELKDKFADGIQYVKNNYKWKNVIDQVMEIYSR